ADAGLLVVARDHHRDALATIHETLLARATRRRRPPRAPGRCRRSRAPGEPPPGAAQLEARPFLQHRRQHAGVEEDVDGEEALVGAEALRFADEPPRLFRLRAEPDAAEVVAALTGTRRRWRTSPRRGSRRSRESDTRWCARSSR